MARTILLTGYGPYGKERYNPSGVLARELDGRVFEGARVRGVRIPVAVEAAGPRLRRLLEDLEPDAAIAMGVAPGRPSLSVERVGLNVLDFGRPDVRGKRYRDRPIRPDGPAAYFSTLPIRPIVAALRRAGVPATISNTAGTYLCNFAMYTVLDHAARDGRGMLAGFIHIPQTPGASAKRSGQPSMELATTRRGLEIALGVVARALRQRK